MRPSEPQFIYVVLVLPTLFGLTLIGEGLSKILRDKKAGWFSIVFGILFIGIVIFAYLFIIQ